MDYSRFSYGDFIREGIDVVTNNQTLLEKARLIEGQKKEN